MLYLISIKQDILISIFKLRKPINLQDYLDDDILSGCDSNNNSDEEEVVKPKKKINKQKQDSHIESEEKLKKPIKKVINKNK